MIFSLSPFYFFHFRYDLTLGEKVYKNQKTMRKSKGAPAQPPAPKGSRLSPSPSRIPKKIPAVNVARSAEDIPRRVQLSCSTELTPLRSISPGSNQGKLFLIGLF